MRIAFLGLGHMGLPMANNLAAAGHEVVGFDVFQGAKDAAAAGGLAVAESGTSAVTAASADIVITMFQTGAQVLDAYRGVDGADGLLAPVRPPPSRSGGASTSSTSTRSSAGDPLRPRTSGS